MAEGLPLTGERTVPNVPRERYWFARHEVAYRWAAERLGAGRGRPALDAGAGEGYGAAMLAEAGWCPIGLEYDPSAAAHIAGRYRGVAAVRANLAGLPVADACVDAVVCMQVVEHLWDLCGFLRDVRRVLRPGRPFVLSTPNRLTFSPGLARGARPVNPFHVVEFDADQLAALLRAAGFGQVEVLGVHHGPRLSAWADTSGRGIVTAQICAVLDGDRPGELPAALAAAVAQTRSRDFVVQPDGPEWPIAASQDLLLVASATDDRRSPPMAAPAGPAPSGHRLRGRGGR